MEGLGGADSGVGALVHVRARHAPKARHRQEQHCDVDEAGEAERPDDVPAGRVQRLQAPVEGAGRALPVPPACREQLASVLADFEHLRRFDLPPAALTGTARWHTPWGKRDLWL